MSSSDVNDVAAHSSDRLHGTQSLSEIARHPLRQRRHWFRNASAVVLVLLFAFVVQGLARNERLQWSAVGSYLFDPRILKGLLVTLELTALSMAIALVLALGLALMRLSRVPILRAVAAAYVWWFRCVPVLVLLFIAYNFSLVYKHLSLGIPFGPELWSAETKSLVSPFTAAVVAFALSEAAFSSEIIRSAILSVPAGQREAAIALGMPPSMVYRRIILRQAIPSAIPAEFNDLINVLKSTSLVSVIAVIDLMYSAQVIYGSSYQIVPLLLVASVWYLVVVSALSGIQVWFERRFRFAKPRRA